VRIDLHTHSTASDGTLSPAEVVAAAAADGLDVVALTDHDTTDGWAGARSSMPPGMTLVLGAELSCAADGISLHLLAYLFDPRHPELAAEIARTRDDRIPRAQEMVRRLAAAGYPLSWDAVSAQAAGPVGRPHIADALVSAGAVRDRDEAFTDLLRPGTPYFVRHYAADPVRVVGLVRAAGGVAVFAHPGAWRRGRVVGDDVIASLAQAGLAGLEVDHPDHDEPTRAHLRGLAGDLGLLVTGASDFHGTGKVNRIGQETTDPEVYAALVAQASAAQPLSAA
jgi:predicted metal-dependent phosphoesterase TrpH